MKTVRKLRCHCCGLEPPNDITGAKIVRLDKTSGNKKKGRKKYWVRCNQCGWHWWSTFKAPKEK